MLRKNFMITDKQDKALTKLAKSEGVSASEILRRVIDAYFKRG
jgi:predicted CopG family antitoxin